MSEVQPTGIDGVVGFTDRGHGRTFTDVEVALLTDLTWTGHDLHANAVAMRGSAAGERMLVGPCVLAAGIGQLTSAGWAGRLEHTFGLVSVVLLGITDVTFIHPVVPGSTMVVEGEVVGCRASDSRIGHVIVDVELRGTDAEEPDRHFFSARLVSLMRREAA